MTIQANFPNVQPSLLLDFANARQLPPQVTFTRATTATYYDGSTTAKAEENTLLESQSFPSSSWTHDNATVTTGQTAPDATSTAVLLTDNTANSDHRIYTFPSASIGAYSIGSVYLKNGTRRYAMMRLQNSGNEAGAVFDLQAGTVTSTGGANYYSSSITSIGSGWYRCVVIASGMTSGVGNFVVAMSNTATYSSNIAYIGNGSTLYAWAAQLENRSTPSVTAYTATTTQAITNYIPVLLTAGGGQPRFDHNPTTSESLGLLREEQRTNALQSSGSLVTGSGAGFWNAYYGAAFVTNAAIAPDGTSTASSMYPMVGGGVTGLSAYYSDGVPVTNGLAYTFSVYLKAGGISAVTLGFSTSGANIIGSFNLSTGTLVSGSGTITSVGNGWYRCSVVTTATSTTTLYPSINYTVQQSGAANNFFANVFAWGAQVETGAFPTSYIPTTSAAATRAADNVSMIGANFTSWFNNQEGTIYYSGVLNGRRTSGFETVAIFTNGTTTTNSFGVGTEVSGNDLRAFVLVGGTLQADLRDGAPQVGTQFKGAFAYQANDFSFCADNGTVQTDSSGLVPSGIDRVTFGVEPAGGSPYNGTINKVAYYPQRITDAQVKALTS